jgi:hypothetical protein
VPLDLSSAIEEVTAAGLLPEQRCAVLVVGSVAVGWDTSTSDLDLCVVTVDPWPGAPGGPTNPVSSLPVLLDPDCIRVEVTRAAGRRCELKYWTDGQLDQTLDKMSWAAFEAGELTQGVLSPEEFGVLQQLGKAVPLEGADWLRTKIDRLEKSATRATVCSRLLVLLDGLTEDAAGHLRAGDTDSGVLTAWLAYGRAVDAVLAAHGELGENPKWRPRRVREIAPPELPYADFWAITTMRDLDPADPARWVAAVIRTCQDLSAEVEF